MTTGCNRAQSRASRPVQGWPGGLVVPRQYVPKCGDIVRLQFNPQAGQQIIRTASLRRRQSYLGGCVLAALRSESANFSRAIRR